MMDVAMCLDKLVPGAAWQGSANPDTREVYEALRWDDRRPKPTWSDLEDVWPGVEAAIQAVLTVEASRKSLEDRMARMEVELKILKGC